MNEFIAFLKIDACDRYEVFGNFPQILVDYFDPDQIFKRSGPVDDAVLSSEFTGLIFGGEENYLSGCVGGDSPPQIDFKEPPVGRHVPCFFHVALPPVCFLFIFRIYYLTTLYNICQY